MVRSAFRGLLGSRTERDGSLRALRCVGQQSFVLARMARSPNYGQKAQFLVCRWLHRTARISPLRFQHTTATLGWSRTSDFQNKSFRLNRYPRDLDLLGFGFLVERTA